MHFKSSWKVCIFSILDFFFFFFLFIFFLFWNEGKGRKEGRKERGIEGKGEKSPLFRRGKMGLIKGREEMEEKNK